MNNISIPLNSTINTKDDLIIHTIDSQDKDVLNKKNSLVYHGVLSNLYSKKSNTVLTTTEKEITTTGNTISIDGVEYTNDGYSITSVFKNKYVWSLSGSSGIFKKGSSFFLDTSNNKSIILSDKDAVLENYIIDYPNQSLTSATYIIGVRVYENKTTIVLISTEGEQLSSYDLDGVWGIDLYSYRNSSNTKIYIGLDDTDVRKRITIEYTIASQSFNPFLYGMGCIGENGLITTEPLPLSVTMDVITNNDRITVLDNGVLAYDRAEEREYTVQQWIDSNTSLRDNQNFRYNLYEERPQLQWGGVHHKLLPEQFIIGYDLVHDNPLYYNISMRDEGPYIPSFSETDIFYDMTKMQEHTTDHIVVNDLSLGVGDIEWEGNATIENGCNPFPNRYFIFNKANNKGIYYDYGKGWARAYITEWWIQNQIRSVSVYYSLVEKVPTSIISYGLIGPYPYTVRLERLSAMTLHSEPWDFDTQQQGYYRDNNTAFYYKFHKFNEDSIKNKDILFINNIGADNMPNHSILLNQPFSVTTTLNIRRIYYKGQYVATAMGNTLLTSASINSKIPHIHRYLSLLCTIDADELISIVSTKTTKIEKISDYLFRWNKVGGNNLLVETEEGIDVLKGFLGYPGEEVIDITSLDGLSSPEDNYEPDGNDTYYSASGYNVQMNDMNNRVTSFLFPAFTFPLTIKSEEVEQFDFQLRVNKKELTKPYMSGWFDYTYSGVDHYYTHSLHSTSIEYQTTKVLQYSNNTEEERLFGVKNYDINKEGFVWWITSDIQIFPIGLATPITGINYLTSTVDLPDEYTVRLYRTQNTTFPVYNPSTAIYKGSEVFTIYGYNYSFDGQAIYFLGQGDDTTQSNFACYALGMRFLANSGTEAYFYSDFEKRIYLFTGSVTLQMSDSLAREGDIIDSIYSSHEQILYILTSNGHILAKTQNDMMSIDIANPTNYHFESTEKGMALVSSTNHIIYRLTGDDSYSLEPFTIETEYLGKNDSLFKVGDIELTFYDKPFTGVFTYSSITDYDKSNEEIEISLTQSDFDYSKTGKIIITPKNNIVKAFQLRFSTNDKVQLSNIGLKIEEISTTTNAGRRY